MNGFLLFTYTASIAVSCMALALSIASNIFHKTPWSVKYIVFQSCLIGIMVVMMMSKLSLVFMPDNIYVVFEFIFDVLMFGCMAFVIVFLPYFLGWVIARPWRRSDWCIFAILAAIYFAAGLTENILDVIGFDVQFLTSLIQTIAFIGMYVYCIVILWVNLKNIDDKQVRHIALSINIVSLSLMPLVILSLLFEQVESFSYPVYVLAFSIIIMVYNYVRFARDKELEQNKPKLSLESLSQYKISEREFSVVELICEGYTNKEIAQELSISVNTVNNHVANIFGKMGVRSRIDLLKLLKEGPWS